jgi:hypothetical protein
MIFGQLAMLALALMSGAPAVDTYAAGQVWEYRHRAGEQASLLKIQAVEQEAGSATDAQIYHISIIGLRLRNPRLAPVIPHSPVSKATLDASVLRQSKSSADFPDATEGIAEWRRAAGGVFTIPVADIVQIIDDQTANFEG